MKLTKFATAAAIASLGLLGAANAAVIASDNFDAYATGATGGIQGKGAAGSGWAGAWSGAASSTVVETVSGANPVGDGPMSGNALRFSNPNSDSAASRALSAAVTGAVWVDYLFQFDNGVIQPNDFLGLWFGNKDGPNMGLKANCGGATGCTADLFVRTAGSGGTYTTDIAVGQTYHLVGLLQKTGSSTTYNKFDLWVDPTNAELLSLTGVDASATGESIASFSTVGFRTFNLDTSLTNANAIDRLLVDNVRLSSTAPLQVPEPAGLALVGVGLLGASLATRRKTRA